MSEGRDCAAKRTAAWKVAAVLAWLVVWEATSLLIGNDIVLCGPCETLASLAALVSEPEFLRSVGGTAVGVLGGFAGAFFAGSLLGSLGARFGALHLLLEPAVSCLKSVPVVCVIVLLLVRLGSARTVSAVVALVAFPPAYTAAFEGVRNADGRMRELLSIHRVSPWRRAVAFWWPSILPFLKASARAFVGMSWKAGVAAELIGIPAHTVGERVYQAKITLSTGDLLAWTLVVVALSVACERAFLGLLDASGLVSRRLAALPAARMRRGARPRSPVPKKGDGPLFSIEGSSMGFNGADRAVRCEGLRVLAGDVRVLGQESGAGKTTLLRTLMGLRGVDAGFVSRAEGVRVSAVFQETLLFGDLTALENVCLFADGLCESEARSLLRRVLPDEALDRPVSTLSGGQKRRVELCRALACPSDAVLLDEPFTGLDEASVSASLDLIDDCLEGRALVVATHCAAAQRRWGGAIELAWIEASPSTGAAGDRLGRVLRRRARSKGPSSAPRASHPRSV